MHCQHATELISRQLDEGLAHKEKIQLHAHLLLCSHCRCFKQQSQRLNQLIKGYVERKEES